MRVQNRTLGDIVRRREIAVIDVDIANIRSRMKRTDNIQVQLAYRKLLKILNHWKKWGY